MPFVAPKTVPSNSSAGSANRTTFRPPWVKDDGSASPLKSTVKTSVPWAKKPTTEKENGEKPTTTTTTVLKKISPVSTTKVSDKIKKHIENPAVIKKTTAEPLKKTSIPAKTIVEPPVQQPSFTRKLLAASSSVPKKNTTSTAAKSPVKEPSPSSSEDEYDEEEESDEGTEEETEEETENESDEEEEDIKKIAPPPVEKNTPIVMNKKQAVDEESELKRRFSLEKPKLRPVVIKRDQSKKKIKEDEVPIEGESEEECERRFKLEKPKLRHVKREEKPLPSKSSENILKIRPTLKKVNKIEEFIKEPKEEPKPEFKMKTLRKTPSIRREPSIKNVPAPPPLPSLVPKAPPPPPSIKAKGEKLELTEAQKAALEKLKTRPRRRPDWSEMMKEVESGRKLRHVECNDRSQPILTCKSMTKVDDKFIYETEKDNSHNKLLKQIQGGIKLKPTKTNDRSKPVLDGLRKFRRQMTIEEQLQKSQSKINMLGETPGLSTAGAIVGAGSTRGSIVSALSIDELSDDELDDIDKIRDDLQSTKQMLALELRNREAQERENKKLMAQIATLEAELAREKSREKNLEYGSNVIVATMEATPVSEECYLKTLKEEGDEARRMAKDLEKKYLDTSEQLDQTKSELEEQKRQIQILERKLAQASQGGSLNGSRRASDVVDSADLDVELSESDPDEPEEKKKERHERRLAKEIKVLRSKLTKLKVKQESAKKEKDALKQAMKKNHVILKEEKKKFKRLEKEVHKMAASMKEEEEHEDEDDEEQDEAEEHVEEEEEESEEESEESESEESETETESESEAEDASNKDKKNNMEPRVKKHENRLSAMKKCNVLLQANVDNLQDEITQVRSKAANLQAELDSVLADLGF